MIIKEMLVQLGLADGDNATKSVEGFDAAVKQASGALKSIVLEAGAYVAALGAIAYTTAAAGDAAAKSSQKVGLEVEAYQELSFAADRSGVSVSELEGALRRQAANAADAANGVGTAAQAYEDLGLSVLDAGGELKGQEQLFLEAAEALSGIENEALKAAYAQDIFGRSGSQLLPMLNGGADGIEALRLEARQLGFVLDEEATQQSEAFIDAMTNLKMITLGVRNEIGSALIPVLTELSLDLQDWYLANKDLLDQELEVWTERLTDAIRAGREEVSRIVENMGGWRATLEAVRDRLKWIAALFLGSRFGPPILRLLGAIRLAFIAMAASVGVAAGPAALALAVIVGWLGALYLVAEDFVTFLNGGESVIGDFLQSIGLDEETLETVNRLLAETGNVAQAFLGVLDVIVARISQELGIDAASALELLRGLMQGFGNIAVWVATVAIRGLLIGMDTTTMALQGWVTILDTITARFNQLVDTMQRGGQILSGLAGGALTSGLSGGAIDGATASGLSSALAPSSTGEVAGSVASSVTSSVQAVFNGLGMTVEEARELIASMAAEQDAQTDAALASGGAG